MINTQTQNNSVVASAINDLNSGAKNLAEAALSTRIALIEQVLQRLLKFSHDWVDACCQAKSITESAARSEEVLGGPASTARYLRLLIQSLSAIEKYGKPTLPAGINTLPDGSLSIPVFPAKGIFDSIIFMGLKAEVWMEPEVTKETLHGDLLKPITAPSEENGIALVLGAGNVSAIPATDALCKLFQESKVVLLKMNPVNDYLTEVFENIFAPLIERDWMRIIRGGAEEGAEACGHGSVKEVHITGSHHTHDAIVWGSAEAREKRKEQNTPQLDKPITSELGNVSPWIIVPGQYSEKELRNQAINIAASLTNNAGFNCVTTRVLVTSKEWEQRDRFLHLLKDALKQIPERVPYYPGTHDRFDRFTGKTVNRKASTIPWTIFEEVPANESSLLFDDESFISVCVEVRLDGNPEEYLRNAVTFCNDSLFGTLCAAMTMTDQFQSKNKELLHEVITNLNYGSVCINQWPGLVYGLMTPPWGAAPGSPLSNVQSGIGHVHNLYFLDRFAKTVFYGPLCNFPKPVWFPSHNRAEQVGWKLMQFYGNPKLWNLPGLLTPALLG